MTNPPTCGNGHTVDHRDEIYACRQKACGKDDLCIGCVWTCADCGEDFCESHIRDLADDGARFSVFVCAACDLKREEAA